jgi:serine/threonine protein kinase
VLTDVGRYRIVSRISKGAMGETFRAETTRPDGTVQLVCVKVLSGEDADDPKLIQEFEREARLVSHLRHPNLVALHELGKTAQGFCWMALELVEGMDLRALLTARRASGLRFSRDVVIYIGVEIAKALHHVHHVKLDDGTVGIIHRDVSPSNILLGEDGVVKLADFGIAKVKQEQRTKTGKIRGKVLYMSPEQALGDPLDGRSDLFALGVVLFELLAGVRPFDGPTISATQLNAYHGKKKDLRALAPDTPEGLVAIVNTLIESDREKRPPGAGIIARLLENVGMRGNPARMLGAIVRENKDYPRAEGDELTEMNGMPRGG